MGEIELASNRDSTSEGGGFARLQGDLAAFEKDLDQLRTLIPILAKEMEDEAALAKSDADKAADSDFDDTMVALAKAVATAADGVGTDGTRLAAVATRAAAKAHSVLAIHEKLYGRLHRARQRKEKTPKPGAFLKKT